MGEHERQSAISPIIAEILMIALVLVAALIAYLVLFQFPGLETIPVVAVDITKTGNLVTLFHKNGDPFDPNQTYITVNGNRIPDANISIRGGTYPWSPGESLVVNYPPGEHVREVKLIYVGHSTEVVLASKYFTVPSGNTTLAPTPVVYTRFPGFTAEAWVKWNSAPNPNGDSSRNWATIVVDGTTDSNRRYQFQHNSDNSKFEFAIATKTAGGSGTWVVSTTTPQSGTWYHVAGVYNQTPGTMAIYVNGVMQSSKTVDSSGLRASPGKYQSGGPAGIQWPGSTSMLRKFNGDIRSLNTYEQALTSAEILAHYTGGHP